MKKNLRNMTKQGANLKRIYEKIAEGVKIRSKRSWHQYGEKPTQCFYGIEKKNAICGTIKALINDGKEIAMPNEICLILKSSYEKLFQKDIKALKKIDFCDNFITWIKILLNDQKSCVINGGFDTQYFTLKKVHAKVILCQHIFSLLL